MENNNHLIDLSMIKNLTNNELNNMIVPPISESKLKEPKEITLYNVMGNQKIENLEQVEIGGEGNIVSSPPHVKTVKKQVYKKSSSIASKKQESQTKKIQIIINNWTIEQKEHLFTFFKKYCEKYVMGEEIGPECGTPHLQCAVLLKKRARFTEVHKLLGFTCGTKTWEGKNKTWESQVSYCTKDATNTVCFPEVYTGQDLPQDDNLYEWQRDLLTIVSEKPDKRKVFWYYDLKGGCGKSLFTKYLSYHHNAIKITGGKRNDVINHVYNSDIKEVIVLDIPRSCDKISYNAIEEIKNGHITNDKYETGSSLFASPHVIIFSNFFPDVTKLSLDRWVIKNINNDDSEYQTNMDIHFGKDM